jgi:hypothetical protein
MPDAAPIDLGTPQAVALAPQPKLPKKRFAFVAVRHGNRFILRRMRVNEGWKPKTIIVHHDNHEHAAPEVAPPGAAPEGELMKSFRLVDGYGRDVPPFRLAKAHRSTRWDPLHEDPFGGFMAATDGRFTFFWPDPIKARQAAVHYEALLAEADRDDGQAVATGRPMPSNDRWSLEQMARAARECVAIHGLITGVESVDGEPMAKAAPDEVVWEGKIEGVKARIARWRSMLVGTIYMPDRLPFHMILHPDRAEAKRQLTAGVKQMKAGKTPPHEGVFRKEEIAA